MTDSIIIQENSILVDLNHYIKHDGYVHRTGAMLLELENQLSKHKKKIVFQAPDDQCFSLTGFESIIDYLINNYQLTENDIELCLHERCPPYKNNKIKVTTYPCSWFRQCKNLINLEKCSIEKDCVLFGAFYGRFTHQRFAMACFLETHVFDQSLVVFQPGIDWINFEFEPIAEAYMQELSWYHNRNNVLSNVPNNHNGCVSALDCLPVYHEIFPKFRIEIVIETNTLETGVFTEKTIKCLISGKPFILLGTQGQLQKLQQIGFKTFSPIINEEYDNISSSHKRMIAIQQEISRIYNLNNTEKEKMLQQLDQISKYNMDNYDKIINIYYSEFQKQNQ